MSKAHRNTICVEDAVIDRHVPNPDAQFVLRLKAPKIAARAVPGSFVHLQCADDIPMRRPLSIMRARADDGWIEVLYKTVGEGLRQLSRAQPGDSISVLGPIGNGFSPDTHRSLPLLIGGGVGIPPLVFLAEQMANSGGDSPIAFTSVGLHITVPGDDTRADGLGQLRQDLSGIAMKQQQLTTGLAPIGLEFLQALEQKPDPRRRHIRRREYRGVQHKHPGDRRGGCSRGRQAEVVGQAQITAMPKQPTLRCHQIPNICLARNQAVTLFPSRYSSPLAIS